jgi:hypothetical protein
MSNLLSFVGQFAASGTSSDVITDPGFQPKVVIFFLSFATSGTNPSTNGNTVIGFSDGTNHRVVSWFAQGNNLSSSEQTMTDNAFCLFNEAPAARGTIAMTATGFTVTWDKNATTGLLVDYIALAGSDLSNVAIGTNTMPTTAIAKATTGLGFTPNFVMLISGSQTANANSVNDAHFSYGCAISSSARFAHTLAATHGATMSNGLHANSDHRTDKVLQGLTAGGAVEYAADFTSFDAGAGFTITFSTAPTSAYQFYYLAIGGTNLNWDISTATRPTTAVDQSRTGLSFQPEVAWWSESDLTTLNTVTANACWAMGASDGTNAQAISGTQTNVVTTVCGSVASANAIIDGLVASNVPASFTSFNSDGWTITWSGTGAANQISAVSLAGTASSAPDEDYGPTLYVAPIDPDITVWQSPVQSNLHHIQCQ